MFTTRSLSPALYYLFFLGEPEQQQRFFKELHFISIAILTFGMTCWLVTFSLTLPRTPIDPAQAEMALAGMLVGLLLTKYAKSLHATIACGTVSVLFISFGFRVLMLGTEEPAFWVLPLGVMITLTTAPIFSGIAYYLGVSLCVWAILGVGQFPVHAGRVDQHWPVLAVAISVIIGLALNIYFLVLRINNHRSHRELEAMAYKDGLTGLNNRRMFTQSARVLQRTTHTPAYFLMIDIDDFKQINDVHGHEVGDEVLKQVADIIAGLSGGHLCGRLGGEEFAIIYQGDANAACTFAAQLVDSVETAFASERKVSVSIGIAELSKEADLSHSYRRADASLYQAKKSGKNRYVFNAT
ncbi:MULTISPECIES: GGDEF domain-containing protein [unclassified Janthinobacterium]|uniref:GGDEF domain-containing protein n=1 Tax=unclassified Janthinobacterium TaxID=2610881 RepID=UPI0018CB0743|nr:GGDEF domain-containing protein [Janthinobacterium sp. CG_23.4]MDH6159992.1 diguanylate cyclase (GGDEF)-like protein [Janthinobacterium sp. CG_23.4]